MPYFHTACGHKHDTADQAEQCPNRGFDVQRLAPYQVIRVDHRSSGIPRTTIIR